MADLPSSGLPSLVSKRDGRIVAFEADKISQSLYAATEDLGQSSAFLARELTDGVLHFLAAEVGAGQPTTTQIAELVAKVVRELGQPALAQVYADWQRRNHLEAPATIQQEKTARSAGTVHFSTKDAPEALVRRCLRSYSLHAVFARDLAAAHQEGLINLTGLDHPEELTRMVLEPRNGEADWLPLVNTPARTIIFDCPEFALPEDGARAWLRRLAEFCAATGRSAILNLHVATPPAWANRGEQGPLFVPFALSTSANRSSAVAEILLEEMKHLRQKPLRLNWHLSEADFAQERPLALENVLRQADDGQDLGLTLDRPRRRVMLATGVDRQHAAVLLDVGLDLPRFLAMTGVNNDARLFLEKLPSLARMAVRAGIQKRNFLRARGADRPSLARGFLLERARLVVVPSGLDQVVRNLLGHGMIGSKLSLDLGRQIVETLQRTLQQESLATNLEIAVDGPGSEFPGFPGALDRKLLHAAGALHGIAGFGTVPFTGVMPEELVTLLQYAWKKTEVVRLGNC